MAMQSLGKGAQGRAGDGSKGASGSISETFQHYKSLFYKGLLPAFHSALGKPLALPFREAASVQMLTETLAHLPGAPGSLSSTVSLRQPEQSQRRNLASSADGLAVGHQQSGTTKRNSSRELL